MEITVINIGIYLLAINAITFMAYGLDKHFARNGHWRIPEKSLFILIMLGGTIMAAIASKIFRHKTKKVSFRAMFWIIVFFQIVGILYLLHQGIIQAIWYQTI